MKAIILAGGSGTRLWPFSREKQPKQLLSFLGGKTLLQNTYARLRKQFAPEDILIVTGQDDVRSVRGQLPNLSAKCLLIEPERRGTAAAIGLAAVFLARRDPHETFVLINSDAHVTDEADYLACLRLAEDLVRQKTEAIVLIGVRPTYPETAYGYIHVGPAAAWVGEKGRQRLAHSVAGFVEKPDQATAAKFVMTGDYLWNPTLVVSQADAFLTRYAEYAPEIHQQLQRIGEAIGGARLKSVLADAYKKLPTVSLDHAILEKGGKMFVVPGEFGWLDIGSWRAVYDVQRIQEGNVTRGEVFCLDAKHNLLFSSGEKVIAAVGVRDLIIVDTDDALLICPRDLSQKVKTVVEELKARGLKKFV